MPKYAILGATGATGSAILRHLLTEPSGDLQLNIFVRSRAKLLNGFPDLKDQPSSKIAIIEGTPDDTTAMEQCLKDVDVIMACIASNESNQNITLAYDTAAAIIRALQSHKGTLGSAYRPPTIIQLRSMSLNPTYANAMPWMARNMAGFCFHYIYADLARASELYEDSAANSPGLLQYIFIDPPALHDANGITPTGYRLSLGADQEPVLSYADLGVAFCEIAETKEKHLGKGVGVSGTGAVNLTWGVLARYMVTGFMSRVWS